MAEYFTMKREGRVIRFIIQGEEKLRGLLRRVEPNESHQATVHIITEGEEVIQIEIRLDNPNS